MLNKIGKVSVSSHQNTAFGFRNDALGKFALETAENIARRKRQINPDKIVDTEKIAGELLNEARGKVGPAEKTFQLVDGGVIRGKGPRRLSVSA